MGLMATGQPYGSITQVAYVVEDIQAAMRTYVDRMGVGPWFLASRFNPAKAVYRGTPNVPLFSLAVAYSGTTMLELIQQHDDTPSVFIEKPKPQRYGFHHWGVVVKDFDAEVDRYLKQGFEIAFSDTAPMGMRVAYMDTSRELPGMIELLEGNAAFDGAFKPVYDASIGWDGRDPIRRM
jgi:catechol 2,3-dioxygenase-like lactoylglutathione lyase family enzyme